MKMLSKKTTPPILALLIAGLAYLFLRPEVLDLCESITGYTGTCFWTGDTFQLVAALILIYGLSACFLLFIGGFTSEKSYRFLQKFSLLWILISTIGISFIPDGGGLPPLPGGRDIIILLSAALYLVISSGIIAYSFSKRN